MRSEAERERERLKKRKQRAGMCSITLWVNREWAAEALALAGYGHPDNDSRAAVQARAQEHFDFMVELAKRGNVPDGTADEA